MQGLVLSMSEVSAWVGGFIWPLFRVAALFSVMPVLGTHQVPRPIRALLALLVTALMLPLIDEVPAVDPLSAAGLILVFVQVLIGVAMGFMVLVLFNAIVMGAESIAMTMGLGFALMSDPQNGVQIPVLGQFYQIMTTLLFLAFNGHHAILQLMAESFQYVPLSQAVSVDLIWSLLTWAKVLFFGALKVALPVIVSLLTVNIVMGVMTRASPQLNVFSVGFPITMMLGFTVILISLPTFLPNFETLLFGVYAQVHSGIFGAP